MLEVRGRNKALLAVLVTRDLHPALYLHLDSHLIPGEHCQLILCLALKSCRQRQILCCSLHELSDAALTCIAREQQLHALSHDRHNTGMAALCQALIWSLSACTPFSSQESAMDGGTTSASSRGSRLTVEDAGSVGLHKGGRAGKRLHAAVARVAGRHARAAGRLGKASAPCGRRLWAPEVQAGSPGVPPGRQRRP